MSLRARLALLTAAAVAVSIALASGVAFFSTRNRLFDEQDRALRASATRAANAPFGRELFRGPFPTGPPRGDAEYLQYVAPDGTTAAPTNQRVRLPFSRRDETVLRGGPIVIRDVTASGEHVRMITIGRPDGTALQVARPLAQIDNTLDSLRLTLALVALGGVALGGLLGLVIARTTLRPVERLTAATEHVAATQDLDASIDLHRNDELGRLANSFNTMLAALGASRQQQRQLVADASHELRTPLTSLRTNIEVLALQPDMPFGERERLLHDLTTQLEEFSLLVGDLVELARDDAAAAAEERVDLRLDQLLERSVARARLHANGVEVSLVGNEPVLISGQRTQLERAFANVLDNASKWSPAGSVIEVDQRGGNVTVRDHGPGIAPEDLPHVFDRFYRSPAARSMPGSGLGLAIVRRVAEQHGGAATAANASSGGTIVTLRLPVERPDARG